MSGNSIEECCGILLFSRAMLRRILSGSGGLILISLISRASGFESKPTAFRFESNASSRTVPDPQKGSKTTSPGFERTEFAKKKYGIWTKSFAG
jgi:hypothetical protein